MTTAVSPERFFISYSQKNKGLVLPIVRILEVSGAQVFRDEDDIQPGTRWQLVLAEELEHATAIIVFWSKAAARSQWVHSEYKEGIATGKKVFPVRLDNAKVPEDLSQYQWIDFRTARAGKRPTPLVLVGGGLVALLLAYAAGASLYMSVLAPRKFAANIPATMAALGTRTAIASQATPIALTTVSARRTAMASLLATVSASRTRDLMLGAPKPASPPSGLLTPAPYLVLFAAVSLCAVVGLFWWMRKRREGTKQARAAILAEGLQGPRDLG